MTMYQTEQKRIEDAENERIIRYAEGILVISGEGEIGTASVYTGKRTLQAIRARLTKERCKGDRWAHLIIDGQPMYLRS